MAEGNLNPVRYFAFEGIVGVGKSEQTKRFLKKLRETWHGEIKETREPGGSEIAEEVRNLVQVRQFEEEMESVTEQYGYAMSRAQTLRKVVRPALDRGAIVVADRSVYTSISYQGFGRGLGVETVLDINRVAVAGLFPHAAFIINTDIDIALSRCHDKYGDKFELMGRNFFVKCIEGYHYLKNNFPNVFEIDGNGSIEEVHERIWCVASGLLGIK